MPALAIWTPEDGLLAAVAPVALAAASDTALMVDLDPLGPRYPGSISLAALVREGPRKTDLIPARAGVAVLPNGGVTAEESRAVVAALVGSWPQVVLRLPPRPPPEEIPWPVVPLHPLFPGCLRPEAARPAVYQRTGYPVPPPGPGLVLPRPRAAAVQALLQGALPPPDGWMRAWRQVWGWPWR